MTHNIQIKGMSCNHCVSAVKSIINELKGIDSINVSLENNSALVESTSVTKETIVDYINQTDNYKAS